MLACLLLLKTHLVCVWVFKFCFLAFRVYILVVHSSAMEIRPDGCDNQPFGKLHTHYISENQRTYVYLDAFICWIIFVAAKWLRFQWSSYLECQPENSSPRKSKACSELLCQTWWTWRQSKGHPAFLYLPLVFSLVLISMDIIFLISWLSTPPQWKLHKEREFFCLV